MKKIKLTPVASDSTWNYNLRNFDNDDSFFKNNIVTIGILFLFVIFYLILFIWNRKKYENREFEQIQYVNHQAENSLNTLLNQMPVGVLN